VTDQLPAPPVAGDADLRDFGFMPLDVVRLRDSDFAARATGEEFRAGIFLWCAAWHQLPAASLPDDDVVLSQLAGYGRALKEWKSVRAGALHGFVKCTDGRLYHPVVAEKANRAWLEKLIARWKRECDRIRKENEGRKEKGLTPLDMPAKPMDVGRAGPTVPMEAPGRSDGIPMEPAPPSGGIPPESTQRSDGQPCEVDEGLRGNSGGNASQGIGIGIGIGIGRERKESSSSARAPRAQTTPDDDDLLVQFKKAAKGNLAPGCANVAPLRQLLNEDCDLSDILSFAKARVSKLKRPLENLGNYWLVPEIRAWSRDRRAAAEVAAKQGHAPAREPQIFVAESSPDWPRAVEAWRRERHKKIGPPTTEQRGVRGWHFSAAILASGEGAKPMEAAE